MPQSSEICNIIRPLNLPVANLNLRHTAAGAEVYDPRRGRWLVLTPEEWVRQHFVNFLVDSLEVPSTLVVNEKSISLNGTTKRCDTVIYSRSLTPLAIVEYKAPSVRITRKVFDQIVRYNMVLHVRYLIVSNGLSHYCCRVDYEAGRCEFLSKLPLYDDMIQIP
ncbi:MAG: type I restriction enzyme HsdR N-terminal domain-containing protein [Muribaculaceae bacterium]|nr:type I restriction enzyme HsdR N-terminal domain-containing protein [Muribaculaceae bacterium]